MKSLIRETTKVQNIEEKISLNNKKKTCYIQEQIATSWKCFEDQNFLTFYLIQGVRGLGLRRGSRQRDWFSVTWGMGKLGGIIFFFVCCLEILVYKKGFCIVNNFKKKKDVTKKKALR